MYWLVTLEDEIRVSPEKLGEEIEKAVEKSIKEVYEGATHRDVGIFLSLVKVEEIKEGKIYPEDPAVHFPSRFTMLVWKPVDKEVVEGEVIDVTEFGVFVRIGAVDGLVHISQVMDDYVSYDAKNSMLVGKNTKKSLKEGDKVRARIISISMKEENKIGLTMRQPGLGALHWLEREKKKGEV